MAEALSTLVEAAQAGDRQALESLAGCADRFVRMFRGQLSQQVRRTQGSTLDFVLEGIARALADIESFEYQSDEHFYAWVTRVIRHRIVDVGRGENRAKRAGRPTSLAAELAEPAGRDPSASAVLGKEELRQHIADAVLAVQLEHPREMEVVVLKIFEQESWRGIRALLELGSEQKARTMFARGIDQLRRHMKERHPDVDFRELI